MSLFTRRMMVSVLVAAAFTPFISSQAADIQERNIKLSLVVDKGTAQYDGAQKFADVVAKKSGGKLNVKIFGGGTLGGDLKLISSLQGGTVEMTLMNASLLAGVEKEMAVWDFPYLFRNEKEADAVLDGPIGKKLADKLPAQGLVGLAYWELGFRNMSSGVRPITKVEDLQGQKMRVIQTPIYIDFMNALGANAVPLPFTELYTALEQKAVDGATNPAITTVVQKFNEVQKYYSVTQHMYNPQILLMSKKFWDQLSPDEKKIVSEAAVEARTYQRQVSRKKNAEALATLKTSMKVNTIAPKELARFADKAKPVIAKYTAQIGEPFVKEVYAEIAKVRGGK